MKMVMAGFAGWARNEKTQSQSLKVVDTGITVVGTALLAVTYLLLHHR